MEAGADMFSVCLWIMGNFMDFKLNRIEQRTQFPFEIIFKIGTPAAQSREASWPLLSFSMAVKRQGLGAEEGPIAVFVSALYTHYFIQSLAQILHWQSGNVLVYKTMHGTEALHYSCYVQ